eukprot:augustus_masked-scaffold_33-processed-gene-0.4-mRNA-1 protein AED:1.00 eAED:1.00 QI:0/-1/0/0/-1/1/1/0/530
MKQALLLFPVVFYLKCHADQVDSFNLELFGLYCQQPHPSTNQQSELSQCLTQFAEENSFTIDASDVTTSEEICAKVYNLYDSFLDCFFDSCTFQETENLHAFIQLALNNLSSETRIPIVSNIGDTVSCHYQGNSYSYSLSEIIPSATDLLREGVCDTPSERTEVEECIEEIKLNDLEDVFFFRDQVFEFDASFLCQEYFQPAIEQRVICLEDSCELSCEQEEEQLLEALGGSYSANLDLCGVDLCSLFEVSDFSDDSDEESEESEESAKFFLSELDLYSFGLGCKDQFAKDLEEFSERSLILESGSSEEVCIERNETLDEFFDILTKNCDLYPTNYLFEILSNIAKALENAFEYPLSMEYCSWDIHFYPSDIVYEVYPADQLDCNVEVETCVENIAFSQDISEMFSFEDGHLMLDEVFFCKDVLEVNLKARAECLSDCQVECSADLFGDGLNSQFELCKSYFSQSSICGFVGLEQEEEESDGDGETEVEPGEDGVEESNSNSGLIVAVVMLIVSLSAVIGFVYFNQETFK